MAEEIATKTKINEVKEDGSLEISVKLLGIKMTCVGSCGRFDFSTNDRRSKIGRAFHKGILKKSFDVTIDSNGNVSSTGNLSSLLSATKSALPTKQKKKACDFIRKKILTNSYFEGIISLGWMHVNPKNLSKGSEMETDINTPPLSGARATTASLAYLNHKEKSTGLMGGKNYIYNCKAGIGSQTKRGKAQVQLGENNRKVNSLRVQVKKKSNVPGSGSGSNDSLKITFKRKEAGGGW